MENLPSTKNFFWGNWQNVFIFVCMEAAFKFLQEFLLILNENLPTKGSHNFRLNENGVLVLFVCIDELGIYEEILLEPVLFEKTPSELFFHVMGELKKYNGDFRLRSNKVIGVENFDVMCLYMEKTQIPQTIVEEIVFAKFAGKYQNNLEKIENLLDTL